VVVKRSFGRRLLPHITVGPEYNKANALISTLHRILRKAPPTKAPNGGFVAVLKMAPLWQFVG
jgi:hypothetical protein